MMSVGVAEVVVSMRASSFRLLIAAYLSLSTFFIRTFAAALKVLVLALLGEDGCSGAMWWEVDAMMASWGPVFAGALMSTKCHVHVQL